MKTLRTILQIPLLLLIVYIGSLSCYQIIRAIQSGSVQHFDWQFYAHIALGALEIAVLIWVYRRLGPGASGSAPRNDDAT